MSSERLSTLRPPRSLFASFTHLSVYSFPKFHFEFTEKVGKQSIEGLDQFFTNDGFFPLVQGLLLKH